MAFNITPPAHLVVTTQGRKFAVYAAVTSDLFSAGVFEYLAAGWTGVWVGPLFDNAGLDLEIKRAGDMKKWIAALAEKINSVFRGAIAPGAVAEVSGSPLYSAILNELNANWKLSVGADGVPVFGPK